MPQINNLAGLVEEQLSEQIVEFMQEAGLAAASRGERLFLAGGAVRDLLLNRPNTDIDLVVEGDAIRLAKQMASLASGKLTTHPRFQTANVTLANWSADFAAARHETYTHPGALPLVKPGTIDVDLYRRDFTINAMAVELTPACWGDLLDPCGGLEDLENKQIKILHEDSFTDDATRIWRALRYEQRLDFKLERLTLLLLKRDRQMLETISADRLRRELELILEEELPEKVFRRAEKLDTLKWLYPGLKGDQWLSRKFRKLRQIWKRLSEHPFSSIRPSPEVYLALLAYRLSNDEQQKFASRLNLRKNYVQVLDESARLKEKIDWLDEKIMQPSEIYVKLAEYHPFAVAANWAASDSVNVQKHCRTFITKLRHIKPLLTGNDLLKLGVPQGADIKVLLHLLREARMDGVVRSKQEETLRVQKYLNNAL